MNSLTTKLSGFFGSSPAKIFSLSAVLLTGIVASQPTMALAAEADDMAARQQYFFNQRSYPLGYIPQDATLNALNQIASLPSGTQGSATIPWGNIGPAPILAGQISPPGPVSGRVTTIAVDPANNSHWLIGGAQGGIWETFDAGKTWVAKTDDAASLAMGAITFAPSDPSIIYAGTGEPNWSGDSYGGAGLLKSTNGGVSWTLLATNTFSGKAFGSIIVNPTNSSEVLAAVSIGVGGRGAELAPSAGGFGIFRSTDGGNSWGLRASGYANDLQADPTDFDHQLATLTSSSTGVSDLRRSLNRGVTWSSVSGPWDNGTPFRIQVAISPTQPSTAYVVVGDGDFFTFGEVLGIWRTDNAWDDIPDWTELPLPDGTGDQLWYDNVVTVDPTNPDTIYFGEIGVWKFDGTDWTVVGGSYDENTQGINFHPDQHALAWAGSKLIIGNDGGVWSTPDGGITFSNHNSNLSLNQFYYGSVHPGGASMALAGSQDNGTPLWTGSSSWTLVGEGDGAENAFSPNNPDVNWAISLDGLFLQRTTDGGQTLDDVFYGPYFNPNANIPFIGRLVMAPKNEDIVLTGDSALIKSTNFMSMPDIYDPTWPDGDWYYDSVALGGTISAIAFAPADKKAGTYAWGSSIGELRLTKNGNGMQAVNINTSGGVPGRYISSLAFDPTNSNVLYVALSGFDQGTPGKSGHLFRTSNALSGSPTWVNVSPAVNIPFNAVVVDPSNSATIYVGTDLGVFKSTNAAASWTHMGPEIGMPNVAVFDMKVQPKTGRVFAFTHGRGTLMLDTNVADLALTGTNGPIPSLSGKPYTFDYTVSNNGPLPVTNAVFTANLSSAVAIASVVTSQGSFTNNSTNRVICNLGRLVSHGSAHVTITIAPNTTGYLTNVANVTSEVLDVVQSNNSMTSVVAVNPADLAIATFGPTNVWVGYPLTYQVCVTNRGPLPATTVTITDILPAATTLLNVTSSQGGFTTNGNSLSFNVGYLDVNYSVTVTITVLAPGTPQSIVNTASVTADQPDSNLANNRASAATDVTALPPPIYNVNAIGYPTAAIISWNTVSNATSQVAYGLTSNYGSISTFDGTLRTNHNVLLTGLVPDQLYYFEIVSIGTDGVTNTATGTFTTTATVILQEPDGAYFGDWTLSSAIADKYGSFYQYANTSADPFTPDSTAAFNAVLPAPGLYDISFWYPSGANHSTNAQVVVESLTDTIFRSVNQVSGGQWVLLGAGVHCGDATASVQIMNNTGELNKAVFANAAKFAYETGQDKANSGSVPSWWAQYYLGTNSVSGSADADGDGYSNYTEYVLGTAPNDPTSQLNFSVESTTNGVQIVFAPYQGGRIYKLQYRATLNSGWTTLPYTPATDIDGNGVFTVSSNLTGFFRLQAALAP